MDIDLGAVRAFLAVVDEGQFNDADDRLGVTPASRLQADRPARSRPSACPSCAAPGPVPG